MPFRFLTYLVLSNATLRCNIGIRILNQLYRICPYLSKTEVHMRGFFSVTTLTTDMLSCIIDLEIHSLKIMILSRKQSGASTSQV